MRDGIKEQVSNTLDLLHRRASKADGAPYFDLFTEDAVFIGTDGGERWAMDEFRAYAQKRFDEGAGWSYRALSRHVFLSPDGKTAWFDEMLEHAEGVARGSGVLLLEEGGWKVAQYHLCFPIPNGLLRPFRQIIRLMGG
ncbi:MAG: nuclear transport factor 2 family protein [Synergistaceae bacterium]|nr:nuclear transport factor 2 family protein [Synergistaceae bacterium]